MPQVERLNHKYIGLMITFVNRFIPFSAYEYILLRYNSVEIVVFTDINLQIDNHM